ncbi:hypothetical protein DRO54_08625 [Candidatus Bathyarchaeota archaeon]|nr:MAG: hypothetical protein DRO54_08625 [Candidatus Bathyarchaeota archaeon]
MVSRIPAWIERLLLPRLSAIEGELKAINTRIDALKTSMEELDKRLTTRIEELEKRMTTELRAINARIDSLEKRLDVAERLAVIEAKLKEHDEALKRLTA